MKTLIMTFIIIFITVLCSTNKKLNVSNKMKEQDKVETLSSAIEKDDSEEWDYYRVRSGDTLMWISYKLYGDYENWRELQIQNPEINEKKLRVGQNLIYEKPLRKFEWQKKGIPYKIEQGDSLSLISIAIYGTSQKWKMLWNKNREMIKDPNLIFAGFTLFYSEEELAKLITK